MKGETFDINKFSLVTGDKAPKTGIKIDLDGQARWISLL